MRAAPRKQRRTETERKRDVESVEESPSPLDHKPMSDAGSFIQPVTKDDPTTVRRPANQKEPPRAPGPG
jgi:hypothetical protein